MLKNKVTHYSSNEKINEKVNLTKLKMWFRSEDCKQVETVLSRVWSDYRRG
jgi:hypothetical protein